MTFKNIAVQNMGVAADPSTVVATIAVASPTGTKVKAEGKLVHRDGDEVTVTFITVPTAGATIADPGPYTVPLNRTTTKVKAEGVWVLRQDDVSDTINATPQIPGTPPTNYPVSFKCKISIAGQTKAKAQ
jgi:hypothetical protein